MVEKKSRRRSRKKKPMNKIVFTNLLIAEIAPISKLQRFYDIKAPGLLVEVAPCGSKRFRFLKKINKTQQWKTIGPFPEVTVEEARKKALILNAELVQGHNFKLDREKRRTEITLVELADLYFELHAKNRCTTAVQNDKNFRRWWAPELSIRISELDETIIQMRINDLARGGHFHRANKARDGIRAILNWGVRKKYLKESPLSSSEGFPTESRTRFVQPHEFERLMNAINTCGDQRMTDFYLVCLYTGARSGKVLSMRWENLDLTLGTWTITKGKNGDPQILGLSEASLEILRRRHQDRGLNPWVFPGGRSHQPSKSHLKEPKKMWSKIIKKAGITDLHIHDLRRTHASYMAMNGANTALIQQALHHKSIQAAAIYQRVNYFPAKNASDEAIEFMRKMAKSN